MRNIFISVSFIFVILINFPLFSAENWKLKKNQDGISTFYRDIEGTEYLESRAITIVNAKLEVIIEVIRDIDSYTQWMPNCIEARTISENDKKDRVIYSVLKSPCPVRYRDVLFLSSGTYNSNTAELIIQGTGIKDSLVPPRKNTVRVMEFMSRYELIYISRDKTGIIFTSRSNPGGSLPSFAANQFSALYAFNVLAGLRSMAAREKYIKAAEQSPDKKEIEKGLGDRQAAKKIITNRMSRYIKDMNFISRLLQHEWIVDILISGNDEIADGTMYAECSREHTVRSVNRLLKMYLWTITSDVNKIEEVSGDREIINMILSGKGTALDEINSRIKKN